MRRPLVIAAALVLVLASVAAAAPAGSARAPQVMVVGDSVAAALDLVPQAKARLAKGFTLRTDLRVCRRLVQPSCVYQGLAPPTALQAVLSRGRSLGDVLVVHVGYNEGPDGYGVGIDRVMKAALSGGARRVVWVTLRESDPLYSRTNAAIRSAARRWPELVVADWNRASASKQWFRSDGLHLTTAGALGYARFLHAIVARAAAA